MTAATWLVRTITAVNSVSVPDFLPLFRLLLQLVIRRLNVAFNPAKKGWAWSIALVFFRDFELSGGGIDGLAGFDFALHPSDGRVNLSFPKVDLE